MQEHLCILSPIAIERNTEYDIIKSLHILHISPIHTYMSCTSSCFPDVMFHVMFP